MGTDLGSVKYGRSVRDEHFAFDPSHTPLNHGSYGAFPLGVRKCQRALQDKVEAQSDPFIRFEIPALLKASRTAAASLLGSPMENGRSFQ